MSPIIQTYRQKSTPIVSNSRIISKFFIIVVSPYPIKSYVDVPPAFVVSPYISTGYVESLFLCLKRSNKGIYTPLIWPL